MSEPSRPVPRQSPPHAARVTTEEQSVSHASHARCSWETPPLTHTQWRGGRCPPYTGGSWGERPLVGPRFPGQISPRPTPLGLSPRPPMILVAGWWLSELRHQTKRRHTSPWSPGLKRGPNPRRWGHIRKPLSSRRHIEFRGPGATAALTCVLRYVPGAPPALPGLSLP